MYPEPRHLVHDYAMSHDVLDNNYMPSKVWVKLLIHSQTSKDTLLKFWDGISNGIPRFTMDVFVLTYPSWD